MRLCVFCLLSEAVHTKCRSKTERERAFEEGDEKEEDTGGGEKEEEKTKMGEMEGLGRRRGDCPVGWLFSKAEGWTILIRCMVSGPRITRGWKEAEATTKQPPPLGAPAACRRLTLDDGVTSQAPRVQGPLHPAPGLRLSVSTHTPPGLEPRPLHSPRQSGRWWLSPPRSLPLPLQAQLLAVVESK